MRKAETKRTKLRKIGLCLFEAGAACFLVGGLALDGPDLMPAAILTVVSAAVAIAGYRLYAVTAPKPVPVKQEADPAELAHRRNAVFREWIDHGTLPGLRIYK